MRTLTRGRPGRTPTPRSANRSPTPAPLRRALFRRRAPPLEGAEWAMKRGGWAKNAVVWSTCRRYIVHMVRVQNAWVSRCSLEQRLPGFHNRVQCSVVKAHNGAGKTVHSTLRLVVVSQRSWPTLLFFTSSTKSRSASRFSCPFPTLNLKHAAGTASRYPALSS